MAEKSTPAPAPAKAPAAPKAPSTRIQIERRALALLEKAENATVEEAERFIGLAERLLGISQKLKPADAPTPTPAAAPAEAATATVTGQ